MKTNPHVALGKNGWLFLRKGTNSVADQLSGSYPLEDDFQLKWKLLFQLRNQRVKEFCRNYQFLIVPNKECVYSEYLPDDMVVTERRPVFSVLNQSKGLVDTIYPLSELMEQKKEFNIFPKNDSHWNHHGFMVAYRVLMRSWGLVYLQDSDLIVRNGEMNDLGKKIGVAGEKVPFYGVVKNPKHRVVADNKIKPLGNLFISEVDDKSLPTCVVFRDSFFSISLHILAQSFRRLVVVWQPNIDYTILEREKPDFVLSQQAERFLVVCPDDLFGKTNKEYADEKLNKLWLDEKLDQEG